MAYCSIGVTIEHMLYMVNQQRSWITGSCLSWSMWADIRTTPLVVDKVAVRRIESWIPPDMAYCSIGATERLELDL
jgi:hypothetical protein